MPYKDPEKERAYHQRYRVVNKENIKKKNKEQYLKNRETRILYQREYYKTHKNQSKEWCKQWRDNNKEKNKQRQKEWREKNREYDLMKKKERYYQHHEKYSKHNKKTYNLLKTQVYNYYTNYDIKCNCCGEKHIEFLSIDHINNDGKNERKTHGTGRKLYKWLINNNYPQTFQVLCMNCNFAKGKSTDHICPHQKELSNQILNH